MSFTTTFEPLAVMHLQLNQQAWEWIPRGAEIVVVKGAIRLHERVYLAEVWVHLPLVLHAGQTYTAAQSGWVQVQALDVTDVRVVVATRRPMRFWWHGVFSWVR